MSMVIDQADNVGVCALAQFARYSTVRARVPSTLMKVELHPIGIELLISLLLII